MNANTIADAWLTSQDAYLVKVKWPLVMRFLVLVFHLVLLSPETWFSRSQGNNKITRFWSFQDEWTVLRRPFPRSQRVRVHALPDSPSGHGCPHFYSHVFFKACLKENDPTATFNSKIPRLKLWLASTWKLNNNWLRYSFFLTISAFTTWYDVPILGSTQPDSTVTVAECETLCALVTASRQSTILKSNSVEGTTCLFWCCIWSNVIGPFARSGLTWCYFHIRQMILKWK